MHEPTFDLVLTGGTIIDGTGSIAYRADLGIVKDRIASIGLLNESRSILKIDITGKTVTPGFIDTHTHDDAALMKWPGMPMKASQGVTTVVIGNCGVSLAPTNLGDDLPPPLDLVGDRASYRFSKLAEYFDYLEDEPPALNVVALVGHMTLRVSTMARLDRPADVSEMRAMRIMLEDSMDAGAVGISSGLAYAPSADATAAEVTDLAACVGRRGGMYCSHIRNEGDGVMEGLCEACDISFRARTPMVISHHKVLGRANFGRSVQTLAFLDKMAARQPIAIDAYPYNASSTVLRLDRVRQSESVFITWSKAMPESAGRTLEDVAAQLVISEEEAVRRLSPAGAVYFAMSEIDVKRILAWPGTMVGSDGLPHDKYPHPRLWGTFTRFIGHYARDLGLMPIEQAVHRMTGLPAETFGVRDRGEIRDGFFADLVVLDLDRVSDAATFETPTAPSTGIEFVMVNGRMVWNDGQPCEHRPGRVLRRQELDPPMRHFGTPEAHHDP